MVIYYCGKMFVTLNELSVHLTPGLTDVQKLNYLKSLLEGDAANAIGGFPLTSSHSVRRLNTATIYLISDIGERVPIDV